MSSRYSFKHKILLSGPSCGKTNFFTRYTRNKFTTDYLSTIGIDIAIKPFDIDGKVLILELYDTSGKERFRRIVNVYFHGATGVILCFDLTNKQTFQQLNLFLNNAKENNTTKFDIVRIILIGCKCDLKDKIVVSNSEINEFINNALLKYGKTIEYFETSAKCNINVTEVIDFMGCWINDENYPEKMRLKRVKLDILLSYFVRNCKINGMYQWFNGINGIIQDYLCKGY